MEHVEMPQNDGSVNAITHINVLLLEKGIHSPYCSNMPRTGTLAQTAPALRRFFF